MTWMRGASRHWPAAVTDTDRDMSKELNTVRRRERDTQTWSIHVITRSMCPQSHQVSLQTLFHVHTSVNINAIRLIRCEFFTRPSSRAAAKWSKTGESNTQPALTYWKKKKKGGREKKRVKQRGSSTLNTDRIVRLRLCLHHYGAAFISLPPCSHQTPKPGTESLCALQRCGFLRS